MTRQWTDHNITYSDKDNGRSDGHEAIETKQGVIFVSLYRMVRYAQNMNSVPLLAVKETHLTWAVNI